MTVFTSACPRNCTSTCALSVTVEEGRVTALDAHPGNRATAGGPCLKGLSYVERMYAPDRILTPMRRTGEGTFAPLGWPEALDLLASRLGDLRARFGPRSLLYYQGSGTKGLLNGAGLAFWRRLGGCTTTYGDLCWPAGLEATRLTLGENKHSAPWDLARARLVVIWGKNPAETNLHQMPFLEEALAAGAECIVIDPRRTQTAERAHLLVQPRPGTDGALALGLAHLLVRDGLVDEAFVRDHVLGYEAFRDSVQAWTPHRTTEVTGVPEATLERVAQAMGRKRPFTLCAGFGMQRYANGGQTLRALLALPVLTGMIGVPGGGWVYANLQSDLFSAVKDPLDCYPEPPGGPVRTSVSTARLGRDMLAQTDPPLRAAWVERGNPLSQNPDTRAVREAFRALDFRVVVDERLTDTALEADLILPSKSLFEQTDVIGAYWHPYLQIRQKVVDPPGEVKPETEVYWHLGRRLGLEEADLEAILPRPTDEGVEAYLQKRLDPFPGLTLARLREGAVLAPGAQEVAFEDRVFPTPSGRIELASREAAERWGVDELPAYRDSAGAASVRHPLHLLTPNTKNGIHSQFLHLPGIRGLDPGPALAMGPEDAAERGLAPGDRVRVHNDQGELLLPLALDGGLRKGVVSAFNGYQGGGVNLLSLGRETDMGHGAAFHDTFVQVEKAP